MAGSRVTGLPWTVVLVGLMGAGKTSVGRRLAERLGVAFTDADDEIERAAGLTIPEIFATHGEAEFRRGEEQVIARLLRGAPGVLATGGGAFMSETTRRAIREGAVSVWLRSDLDTLVERVSSRTNRPLLDGRDARETLGALIDIRYPQYAEADLVVDSGPHAIELTVDRVWSEIRKRMTAERYGT